MDNTIKIGDYVEITWKKPGTTVHTCQPIWKVNRMLIENVHQKISCYSIR